MKKAITLFLSGFLLIGLFSACSTANAPSSEPPEQPLESRAASTESVEVKLRKLEVAKAPDKLIYTVGEMMDDTGAQVNAIMTDGSVVEDVDYGIELTEVTSNTHNMIFTYDGKMVYQRIEVILPGNSDEYSVANTESISGDPLSGKRLYFLGSSVTFGAHSGEEAIPEFMDKVYGTISIKEAVSGTTLAISSEPRSYIERFDDYLSSSEKAETMDAFIIQLSTNDTSKVNDLGVVMPDNVNDPAEFDKNTTLGAMEYLIAQGRRTWNCPILFYTNPPLEKPDEKKESSESTVRYQEMIDGLYRIAEKWDISVIDLYYDEAFNDLSSEKFELYMADTIHPTKAGYRDWWLPKFYEGITKAFDN